MKIRCGSHQQNRSIVRPGLSLMAAKVALTAEEFRENSQRSIALFNTEKLSTNSTHVLKSAYCNSVHFCRCNLHGACGGKVGVFDKLVARPSCNLHGACGGKGCRPALRFHPPRRCNLHGACGGKEPAGKVMRKATLLQSARSVWRQSPLCASPRRPSAVAICTERVEAKGSDSLIRSAHMCCNLHGACGGKV